MRQPLRVNPTSEGTPRSGSRGLYTIKKSQHGGCQKSASRGERKLSEEVGSHGYLQAFSEDHKEKGKIRHESSHGEITASTKEDANMDAPFFSQTSTSKENTPLDNHNSVCEICKVGGELLCCDGKDCLLTYHLSCLHPPLDQVPPGDWFCPACVSKKISFNSLFVPPTVESIWDVMESDIITGAQFDNLIARDVSDQSQREKHENSQSKQLGEAEHNSSMPASRKNSVSKPPVLSSNSLQDVSLCDLETVVSNGYKVNSESEIKREKMYFVKYKGCSHVHNQWVTESQIMKEAPKQLSIFKRKVQQGKALKWNPLWTEPHRLIRKRVLMPSEYLHDECNDLLSCRVEWLVKWKGLGYDQCTWELEGSDILASASASELIRIYEQRSKEAQQRALPAGAIKAKNLRDAAYVRLKELPEWIREGNDLYHRLQSINKLCKFWQTHQNAVIVDEINQERILTTIKFILLLIKRFEVARPILVAASSTTISSWEDELLRFDSLVNFVVFNGNRDSREVIRKQELYDESGHVMVQIILTTYDTIIADLEYLKHLEWEAIIVDEFQRINLPKSLNHLMQLLVDFRLVLFSEEIKENSFEMSCLLSFLNMDKSCQIMDTHRQDEVQERKGERTYMKKLSKYIIYEQKSDHLSDVQLMEYWVPVELTNVQVEQYCSILIRNSGFLCLPSKTSDYVEHLREILLSLRKCCNHPYLVNLSLENELTKRFPDKECLDVGINASGKLQLLDSVLSEIKLKSRRLLILFQTFGRSGSASLGDILDDHLRRRLGDGSYERIDGGLTPAKKQAALQRFNCKDSGRLVFLLEKRACGPNIKLSSIDTVIIFNSDWNSLSDLRSLQKAHIDTKVDHLKVFRFYSPYTVEERLLISAKLDIELDNNLENINGTLCQQLLRWGVSHQFQNYDKFHGSGSPSLGPQCLYSYENRKILVEGMLGSTLSVTDLDGTLWHSLVPRVSRMHGYGKGILLFGESEDKLEEEGKVSSNVFWTNLLNARHVEPEYPSRRQERLKKKVQYSEWRFSKSKCEIVDTEVKEKRKIVDAEVKSKHRKVGDTIDPMLAASWIRDAKKSLSIEKERDEKVIEKHRIIVGQLSHAVLSSSSSDVFKEVSGLDVETVSETSCRKVTNSAHNSPLCTSKESLINEESVSQKDMLDQPRILSCASSLEGSLQQNQEIRDDKLLCLTHNNFHSTMKQEIVLLCNALQFPDEVIQMAKELCSHVVSSYRIPVQEISLAQALEISLCLAAANRLKHVVDIDASLELAQSQFRFNCSRKELDSVYQKLCQRLPSLNNRMPLRVAEAGNGSAFAFRNASKQKNVEDTWSKDDRASSDDRPSKSVWFSPVQSVIHLETSTGLDVHQHERVEKISDFETNSQEEDQKSNTNPVQEEMNCHPERLISVAREHYIDVPNQNAFINLESDPKPNKLSQCQKQQSELTGFSDCFDSHNEKHNTMDHNMDKSKIDSISKAEIYMKSTEEENASAKQIGEPDQHLSRGSECIKTRQDFTREENNRRHNSMMKDTSAKTVQSQASGPVNVGLTADISSVQPIELWENRMDSPCRVSSAFHIDQCSQGNEPNFLQEWELNHMLSSQLYHPAPSAEIRGQVHAVPESSFTDNLNPNQNQQCDYMNTLESQNQSQCLHHSSGISQAPMFIGPSQPFQSMITEVGSNITSETVAATPEPSTMHITSSCSPDPLFSYPSMHIGTSVSSRLLQPNFTDPLFHEMLRIRKENEHIKKLHEEESAQIKAKFQCDFEELKNKYDGLLWEKQLLFEEKSKNLKKILVKVGLNQRLGEMIRLNFRRENNSTVSGSANQLQQSYPHATHTSNEILSQSSYPSACPGMPANIPDRCTAARAVQASAMFDSQVSSVPNTVHGTRVVSNANSLDFDVIGCNGIPMFQSPADFIVHVSAPPTSIASITPNSRHEVLTSTFSLISPSHVTEYQPSFELNANTVARNIQEGVRDELLRDWRTSIPESSSSGIAKGVTNFPSTTSNGQTERSQLAAISPQQVNCISTNNNSDIAGVIYLSDDD